ncbi:PrsW family intramembrane metalloprotease [Patescibacteria group bacterium]|nr:PrsW family intramembrane metalloprotease [Patescibacteria group bacterium]MBU2218896.1 PrsW family intramembrane metalloprotease [Patescibacteria group bacterium]MBU2263292.1 PrsW family intramembrane metalloprotease [Patescibacteria group bacterium]
MGFLEINSNNLFFSLALGIIPALIWLWFWLREDLRPEPRSILFLAFFAGMLAVGIAFIFENAILFVAQELNFEKTAVGFAVVLFFWALIEEILKYLAAKHAALKKPCFDEPVDALIYLITAALGFAALENFFFLLNSDGLLSSFITGNLRFLGATLLHTATSAVVGASIAFSFFHKESRKRNVIGGIAIATILHFIFNYFIINMRDGVDILKVFIPLWIVIIVIIFIFEKVKRIKK